MSLFTRLKLQLFRWRDDGTAPVTLDRQRIFILPTGSGMLFALALIVMLLTAINYNLALGHALVFLLAGLGLTGMIHTFRNLHGLKIAAERSPPVFAGELAQFELRVSNMRSDARRALVFAAAQEMPCLLAVDGNHEAKISIAVSSRQRGWLPLPRIRLASQYPLGLFTAWCYLQPTIRCLVYPRPINSPLPLPLQQGSRADRQGDSGQEDFAGFRERQPADSLRHVAWKASAHADGQRPLLIKRFSGGSEGELCLNWSATDPRLPAESRLSVLCGWVLAASAQHLSFSLQLPDRLIPADRGPTHQARCLEALALCQP